MHRKKMLPPALASVKAMAVARRPSPAFPSGGAADDGAPAGLRNDETGFHFLNEPFQLLPTGKEKINPTTAAGTTGCRYAVLCTDCAQFAPMLVAQLPALESSPTA